MNVDQVEALVKLVSRSTVAEITVRSADRRITVRRNPAAAAPPQRAKTARREPAALPVADESGLQVETLAWVSAPLVGIFYHAEPPVVVGSEIEPGQVIGVIESMKLMNEVRSDHGGTVVECSIEAGMAVEYGQPLFGVRPKSAEAEDEEAP